MATDRKAWLKLPDSVLREPWDDATLATMVRLMSFLNTRWARDRLSSEEAATAFLTPQDAMLVTSTTNATRARRRLRELPERSGAQTLEIVEATVGRLTGVRVSWPEFVEFQGYPERECPGSRGRAGAAPPSPQKHPKKQKQGEEKPASRPSLPPSLVQKLLKEIKKEIPDTRLDDGAFSETFAAILAQDYSAEAISETLAWAARNDHWRPRVVDARLVAREFPKMRNEMVAKRRTGRRSGTEGRLPRAWRPPCTCEHEWQNHRAVSPFACGWPGCGCSSYRDQTKRPATSEGSGAAR